MAGLQITDMNKFRGDIERAKQSLKARVVEGLKNAGPYIGSLMTQSIDSEVYQVYSPAKYKRTMQLLNSVVLSMDGDTLIVYPDPRRLTGSHGLTVGGRMTEHNNLPYSVRVLKGHAILAYEHVNEDGAYLSPRDWRTKTFTELVNNLHNSNAVKALIVEGARKL